jgi:gamma-butyrobetaine dioxygenase
VNDIPRITGHPRSAMEPEGPGAAVLRIEAAAREASLSPWTFAERLFGERVVMVERQPIRAVPGGRTFASSSEETPLHTDSQPHFGVPASAQVLVCERPAAQGGESVHVDAWELVSAIADKDPDAYARLFDETRTLRFYFGDFVGPTLSLRRGHLFFTHPPFAREGDRVPARLKAFIDLAQRALLRLEPDDVLVVNNHRVLHGRRAFEGTTRELVRLLVWLETPWAAPEALFQRVRRDECQADPAASRALGVVLELLRGVPPGILSAREKITEAELYRWRDAALAGAGRALASESLRSSSEPWRRPVRG